MTELRIAPNLALPIDAVTESMAIVARKGRGKTYTAKVIAEEMLKAHLHIVILDPLGAWTGLRTSADGKRAGLPITILGGKKGDLPLSSTSGAMIADLVVDEGVSLLLDLSHFESNAEQDRFAKDFAVRLFQRKKTQPDPAPIHLFVDESDSFAPQQPLPGQQTMLGAFQTLVRRGRMAGIGTTFITQRPASLHKGVLTMTECLIVLQVTGPQDRDALEKWVKGNADLVEAKRVLDSLASLEVGEAWFWSPSWLKVLKRVRIRKAETFDSSATPKAGQAQVVPKVLAKVDLDRLSAAMAETIEKAKDHDPKELHKRIRGLESDLRNMERDLVTAREAEPERVEVKVVPVLSEATLEHLESLLAPPAGLLSEVQEVLCAFREGLVRPEGRTVAPKPAAAPAPPRPAVRRDPAPAATGTVGKGPGIILSVLVTHGGTVTKARLRLLTGQAQSTFDRYLLTLRNAALVLDGNPVTITDAGRDAAPDGEAMPPPGAGLFAWWCAHQKVGVGPRAILNVLRDSGGTATKADLRGEVGQAQSTFDRYLLTLRNLGIVTAAGSSVELDHDLR